MPQKPLNPLTTNAAALQQLQLFIDVADAGGFTATANTLNLPVATVSRKIAQLEKTLRVTLFIRNTRNVRLSPEGEALYAQLSPALSAVHDALNQVIHDTQQIRGLIRITAPSDLVSSLMTQTFARFLRLNPDIQLRFHLNTDLMNLVSERIDIAIRAGKLADSSLYARHLFDIHLKLYAAPAYLAGLPPITHPDGLKDCNILQLERQSTQLIDFIQKTYRIPVNSNLVANEMGALISFCLAGAGVALLPQISVAFHLAQGQLIELLPDCTFPAVPVHALTPEKNPPARVRRMIEFLQEQYPSG